MKTDTSILRAYIIPVLVVLLVVLLVPFVLLPQIESIREKNLEVEEGRERLERLNQKIDALELVDETAESLKLLETEKAIPANKKIATLIVGIRSMAVESKLSIREMNFKPGKVATQSATVSAMSKKTKAKIREADSEENKDSLLFVVKLRGKLDSVKKFLSKLEKAKRLMEVDTLSSTQDEDEPSKHLVEISIRAPFKQIKSGGDVVSDPLPLLTKVHDAVFTFLVNLKDYTNKKLPSVPTGVPNPFK
jgi:Tfp pilus assembly protein PilO